jgi:hypothetical protein
VKPIVQHFVRSPMQICARVPAAAHNMHSARIHAPADATVCYLLADRAHTRGRAPWYPANTQQPVRMRDGLLHYWPVSESNGACITRDQLELCYFFSD